MGKPEQTSYTGYEGCCSPVLDGSGGYGGANTGSENTGVAENLIYTVGEAGSCGVTVHLDPASPTSTATNRGDFCENGKITVTATSAGSCIQPANVLPEPPIYTVRDESSLNRADPEEIDRSKAILDGYQLRLLGMIDKKIQKHPQRYDRDQYRQTASFLILCKSPSAQRLAFCGIPSAVNPSGRCRLHQYCPYCCWRERTAAQLTYVPGFYQGTWHFLTGSFEGDLGFTCSDGYDWLHYWDAYKHGLSALVEEGLIDGAYWTEELAVNSLLPTRV